MEPALSGGGAIDELVSPGRFVSPGPEGSEGTDSSFGKGFVNGGTISGFGGGIEPDTGPVGPVPATAAFGGEISGFGTAASGFGGVICGNGGRGGNEPSGKAGPDVEGCLAEGGITEPGVNEGSGGAEAGGIGFNGGADGGWGGVCPKTEG